MKLAYVKVSMKAAMKASSKDSRQASMQVSMLALVAVLLANASPGWAESTFIDVQRSLDNQDNRGAVEMLLQMTRAQPNNERAWRMLGETYCLNKSLDKAAEAFRKAVELDGSDDSAWEGLGISTIVADPKTAVEALKKATELKPGNWIYWSKLSETTAFSEPETAVAAARKAVGLNAQDKTAWKTLRDCSNSNEDYATAIEAASHLILLEPNSSSEWFQYMLALDNGGQREAAEKVADYVIKLKQKQSDQNDQILFGPVIIRLAQTISPATNSDSQDERNNGGAGGGAQANQYAVSALQWAHKRDHSQAVQAIQEAIRLNGDDPEYRFMLAGLLSGSNGTIDDAVKALLKATELKPTEARYWIALSSLYLRQYRFDKALESAQKGVALNSKLESGWLAVSNAAIKLYQFDLESEGLNHCLQINPESEEAWETLARVQTALGKSKEAKDALANEERYKLAHSIESLKFLSQLQPNNPAVWSQLSKAYSASGNGADAQKAIERAQSFSHSL